MYGKEKTDWLANIFNDNTLSNINYLAYHHVTKIKMEIWKKILYWLLSLFILFLIIVLLQKIFGGSLGFEEIVIGLLIANLGYSFYINSKLSEHLGWHKGREGQSWVNSLINKYMKQSAKSLKIKFYLYWN